MSASASAEQRNAEIWSTRLQRELLALTAGGADDTQAVAAVLPPFLTLQDHQLDIAQGLATVSFRLTVPPKPDDALATTHTTDHSEQDVLVIVLDASMPHKGNHQESVDLSKTAYPFVKPHVMLKSGASHFPPGSTVQNGDELALDCDWTPSLHLTDAVLNVGLLIKESILQGEPYHKKPFESMMDDPVEEMKKGARRFGSFLSKSARGWVPTAQSKEADRSSAVAAGTMSATAVTSTQKPTSATDLVIGDEISLLEAPWTECRGLYSCKAIRRPGFVEDAMTLANHSNQVSSTNSAVSECQDDDDDDDGPVPEHLGSYMALHAGSVGQVAGAGLAGAGAMFRSFTKSAKSVLEESFLMVTDTHLIELRSSKLNLTTGIVSFLITIDLMAKLKFRREESISLFFKAAPDDPLIYMCPDSADAVRQIQTVLQSKHGVKGKHTNAAMQRAIHEALQVVQEIQAKERALQYQPSTERVNEIMDLYRQAAERFEVAGDARHEEVVEHMRTFLALPLVVSILDGSYVEPSIAESENSAPSTPTSIPEGEVIERTPEQLAGDDDAREIPAKTTEDDKIFADNMDNIMKEAKEDLATNLNGGDDVDVDPSDNLDDLLESDIDADAAIADLDELLRNADKEMDDIMSS